jgi:hypothetical protein
MQLHAQYRLLALVYGSLQYLKFNLQTETKKSTDLCYIKLVIVLMISKLATLILLITQIIPF